MTKIKPRDIYEIKEEEFEDKIRSVSRYKPKMNLFKVFYNFKIATVQLTKIELLYEFFIVSEMRVSTVKVWRKLGAPNLEDFLKMNLETAFYGIIGAGSVVKSELIILQRVFLEYLKEIEEED